MTLQVPAGGQCPHRAGLEASSLLRSRVPASAVSPLAGGAGRGAGGKARSAELAGWKQGHGAAGLSARTPGPAAPAASSATARGPRGQAGDSRWPHSRAAGPPCSPLPQRVLSARWVCVTAASSSSPPLTWGASTPAPSTAHPGRGHSGMGGDATTSGEHFQPCCRFISRGFTVLWDSPELPTPGEAGDLGSAAAPRFAPHSWGSCSKCGPRQGCPRRISCGTFLQNRVGPCPPAPLPPLSPRRRRALPPYLLPRLQLGAGGHGTAGVARGQQKMPSGTGCAEGWEAALA